MIITRMKRKRNKNYFAFTLVEVLVALTVFVVFIVAITNIFILAQSSQRFLSKYSLVVDNLSFALERMSREIRLGTDFSLVGGEIRFINAYGQSVVYRLRHYKIERSEDGGATFSPITSENIKVDDLKFILQGQGAGDGKQPRITISVKFASGQGKLSEKYEKVAQTTVSARELQD